MQVVQINELDPIFISWGVISVFLLDCLKWALPRNVGKSLTHTRVYAPTHSRMQTYHARTHTHLQTDAPSRKYTQLRKLTTRTQTHATLASVSKCTYTRVSLPTRAQNTRTCAHMHVHQRKCTQTRANTHMLVRAHIRTLANAWL